MGQHRQGHVARPLRVHEQQERVLGPIGVPEGENRIIIPSVCMVDRTVEAPIGAVHVVVDGRIDHCMVEGRIEHPELVRSAFRFKLAELPVPGFDGLVPDAVEGFLPAFGAEILQGPLHGSGTEGDLYRQFV